MASLLLQLLDLGRCVTRSRLKWLCFLKLVLSISDTKSNPTNYSIDSFIFNLQTRGTSRKLERGDAGDTINFTDSTLLSVSSILDDDFDGSVSEYATEGDRMDDVKTVEFKNRSLWDVLEEDQLIVGDYE